MSYTALYRKFRPDTFEDVKGQEHIVTTLKNQIKANRIGHAYLFCGTRGTGKTTVAKILAKAVNCEHPVDGSPCNQCETCRAIASGASMNVIEIDAASNNGVDNIREIREEVAYRPTQGKYKVYIIDEVHMLSVGAFNALLKTLEEPPSYVIFILATTEAHKIPVTILSRCQRYDFRRITIDTISARLMDLMEQEQVEVEERAIRYVAKAADGSMRDALSLLDQCIAFYLGQTLTYDKVLEVLGTVDTEVFSALLRQILSQNVVGCIHTLEELITQGKELGQLVTDFTWYLRNLLLVKNSSNMEEVLDVSTEHLKLLQEESTMVDTETLMRYIRVFSELSGQLRYASQKRVLVEIALIKLCRPSMEQGLDSVLDRLRILEEKVEQGIPLQAAPGAGAGYGGPVPPTGAGQGCGMAAPGGMPGVGGTAAPQEAPKKAAPEDLQQVKREWKMIVGQSEGMFKQMLLTARPKYNGDTGEAKLYVEFTNPLAANYVNNPEAAQMLERLIQGRIGKSVEVEMLLAAEHQKTGLAEISIDDLIKEAVHMPVVVEEEPDEE
ncbi:MAG TPA: DNA polymerase III subunit gamma/tau [Candidatus Egerieimonas intestinavium]|uniref:DNA-directed DNA polymerase n=1 Tax=Candidatus Egerieimonas intestinavium TaxID=2840777 RepID=A0A9D1EKW1_9FIRM|nr:DNA polymerase III subunit gamma/tau [Candidatus Egerieimonas intestinavium]